MVSGALIAAGEVDTAIGGDQGGSIRMPASYCGIAGMKATHGLAPYTGVMPIESTIDQTGPMTVTAADNALMLEVLAGADGLDPRQNAPKVDAYTKAFDHGVKGMKIAIEGLQWQMMQGNGLGMNWKGAYDVGLFDYHAGWRTKADDLSESLKLCMMIGQ